MDRESFGEMLGDHDIPEGRHAFESMPAAQPIEGRTIAEHLTVYRTRYKNKLITMAANARGKAVSHRSVPFRVGSAILTASPRREYTTYASHNWTPSPGTRTGGDKRCAERNAIDAAMLADKDALIVAITTVSHETSTGDHTATHNVLHPCKECRTLLRQMITEGHIAHESVLCSVNDARTNAAPMIIEEKSVREILDLYDDDLPLSESPPTRMAA